MDCLGSLLNVSIPCISNYLCEGQEELQHPEEAILGAKKCCREPVCALPELLTCAGLVSGRTSSKPAPESYFITSCISDDIMKGLDQKATHRSLNNYDKSKYNAREFKPENLFSPT